MPRNGAGTYALTSGNPVVSGTTISSTTFNNTLTDIANALTTSVASDGQTAMTANLDMGTHRIVNVTNGASAQDAATYGQLTSLLPTGAMLDYAGTSAPSGFLLCDGSAVSRTTNAALFAAIGTIWGAGDGSTTFNVPDLRRRTTIGAGGTAVTFPVNTVGAIGGEELHQLTTAELAAHNHPITVVGTTTGISLNDPGHAHLYNAPAATQSNGGGLGFAASPVSTSTSSNGSNITVTDPSHNHSASSSNTGSGTAHNNMQPSAVVTKIIKT